MCISNLDHNLFPSILQDTVGNCNHRQSIYSELHSYTVTPHTHQLQNIKIALMLPKIRCILLYQQTFHTSNTYISNIILSRNTPCHLYLPKTLYMQLSQWSLLTTVSTSVRVDRIKSIPQGFFTIRNSGILAYKSLPYIQYFPYHS